MEDIDPISKTSKALLDGSSGCSASSFPYVQRFRFPKLWELKKQRFAKLFISNNGIGAAFPCWAVFEARPFGSCQKGGSRQGARIKRSGRPVNVTCALTSVLREAHSDARTWLVNFRAGNRVGAIISRVIGCWPVVAGKADPAKRCGTGSAVGGTVPVNDASANIRPEAIVLLGIAANQRG